MQLNEQLLNQTQRSRLEVLRAYAKIARDPTRRVSGKDYTESSKRELDDYVAELCRLQIPKPVPADDRHPDLITAERQLSKAKALFEKKQDATAWANLKACEAERERVIATIAAREKEELERLAAEQRAEQERRAAERAAVVAKARTRADELVATAVEHLIGASHCWKQLQELGIDGVDVFMAVRRIHENTVRTITTRSDLQIPAGVLMTLARGH